MDIFSFRDRVVEDYGQFSRSFTEIKAPNLQAVVDVSYAMGEYWPSFLIQPNPSFVNGEVMEELVDTALPLRECSRIFRWGKGSGRGQERQLIRHQMDELEIARRGNSLVVTSALNDDYERRS
jgi:ATP-dependent helicase YprA (DUF1998 family)